VSRSVISATAARGHADADQRGGRRSRPVPVAQQMQPGLGDRAGTHSRDTAVGTAQPQRREVREGGAESGAPEHRLRPDPGAIGPHRTVVIEAHEHRAGVERPGVAGLTNRWHLRAVDQRDSHLPTTIVVTSAYAVPPIRLTLPFVRHDQCCWASRMRLPQVSSNTACAPKSVFVGSWVNLTPRSFIRS
jgi:hypothetical protein